MLLIVIKYTFIIILFSVSTISAELNIRGTIKMQSGHNLQSVQSAADKL